MTQDTMKPGSKHSSQNTMASFSAVGGSSPDNLDGAEFVESKNPQAKSKKKKGKKRKSHRAKDEPTEIDPEENALEKEKDMQDKIDKSVKKLKTNRMNKRMTAMSSALPEF